MRACNAKWLVFINSLELGTFGGQQGGVWGTMKGFGNKKGFLGNKEEVFGEQGRVFGEQGRVFGEQGGALGAGDIMIYVVI